MFAAEGRSTDVAFEWLLKEVNALCVLLEAAAPPESLTLVLLLLVVDGGNMIAEVCFRCKCLIT